MKPVSIKEARRHFAKLLAAAERGGTIPITRRGREVAVIAPSRANGPRPLPDLADFRAAIAARGGGKKNTTTTDLRDAERY